MKAVVFHGIDEGARVEDVEDPSVKKPTDVLLKVAIAGICGSDSAILEGRHPSSPPVILGHEYSGEVLEVGDRVETLETGDHVAIDPNIKCGRCYYCRRGKENLCQNMTTLGVFIDGGFTEYNLAPESAVYKLPNKMKWEDAVLAEPVSCVLNGINRAEVKQGDNVVIIGAGPMGLLWTRLMRARGAGLVIVSDIVEERLKFAKEAGADVTVKADEEDLMKAVKAETGGRLADIAVEAVGSIETVKTAIGSIKNGGRVVLFGTVKSGLEAAIEPYDITRHEKEIVGSYIANYTFRPAIEAMYRGLVDSSMLISHKYELEDFQEAMETHQSGQGLKVILRPS